MENLPQFNLADLCVMVFILAGALRGLFRGLSSELARLLSVAAAVGAGIYYYQPLGRYLIQNTRLMEWGEPAAHGISFGILFVGAWLAMRLLRLVLRNLMEFAFRGKIEKVGGALAGFLRSAIVAAAILLLMGFGPIESVHRFFLEDSLIGRNLAQHLLPVYDELWEKYPALRALPRREALDAEAGPRDRDRPADLGPPEDPAE